MPPVDWLASTAMSQNAGDVRIDSSVAGGVEATSHHANHDPGVASSAMETSVVARQRALSVWGRPQASELDSAPGLRAAVFRPRRLVVCRRIRSRAVTLTYSSLRGVCSVFTSAVAATRHTKAVATSVQT
ncbi:hypothetical protein BASA60_011145 [Batrachochytrium salamandrivorans]|nr:hypothetical protein BASA60_011145 [Batrachochytrium salamandrivorans]